MMNLRRKVVHYQRIYLQSFLCLQTASIRHFDVTRTAQNVPQDYCIGMASTATNDVTAKNIFMHMWDA